MAQARVRGELDLLVTVRVARGRVALALTAGERVLRLYGLGLLAVCIGKVFAYDLRELESLPRILSFVVLGALLLVVSFAYTRFREKLHRYL